MYQIFALKLYLDESIYIWSQNEMCYAGFWFVINIVFFCIYSSQATFLCPAGG